MPARRALILFGIALAVLATVFGSRGLGPPPVPWHDAFGHGPTIVLVHGLGSRSAHWFRTARLLARRHRVVMIELPGHGESARAEPLSLDRAAEALDAALAGETREPVVLVGHSIGGLVAAAEAIRNPARVRALVLVETALRPQVDGQERSAMLAALDSDYQSLLRAAYGSFGRDSAQGIELYHEVAALDSNSIKPWVRLALTADLSAAAADLRPPTLAVLAERSWAIGEAWRPTAEALGLGRIHNLRHERILDAGHFIMLDQPERLARMIEQFIAHPGGEPVARR